MFFTLFLVHAFALDLNHLQGEARREYVSPQNSREMCVIPKKWQWGSYKKGDIEDEDTLCSFNFYSNMGICPKYNSTNPAILLLAPNAKYSKPAIDNSNCDVDAMGVKTEAKFKQSLSCSYTPSILAYYHMSRLLGNAGRVPVAVIRSMDIRVHRELTLKANRYLRNSKAEIAKTWAQFAQVHNSPREYPSIVDASQSQIYGALVDNVKNEEYYTDVSGRGSYDSRYQRFLRQKAFVTTSTNKSITQIVGASDFARIAQTVTMVKDTGDMILLDTLLNQQDRIGNVHYKFYWYYVNGGKIERMKSEAKWVKDKLIIPQEERTQMQGRIAAHVKEMVLKDNDCGVRKDNMMRKISALEKVRHFSYQTYRRFIAFEKTLNTAASKDYFINEMLFSDRDYASLRENAKKAREILYSGCRSGNIRFDVDLENYVPGGVPLQPSCEG